ncbi:MAG: pimeloyl-[acyl-carrier protein] methyl ester esterase [Hydrogenophilales bacterium 17-64-11]|nr:MAG: pimeloyl-[acyl-carrier protein] methyl ester esterase [Hydrogenophilales bacterium 17-64-11]
MPSPKPCLALVHGWGMNARVFDELAVLLAAAFEVRALDLPGHGGRDDAAGNTLRGWADELVQQLPDNTILLGWSLGGQVAMRAALDHPHKIARLVLLASTPKFVATEDWPHGMAPADLQDFGAALLAEPEATLLRFLSLQTRGMPGQKTLLQRLRQTLLAAPVASAEALAGGLAMLRDTDLRAELPQLAQPVLVLHGALDTLTPPAAGAWLAEALPRARHIAFCRAAHAPHLSHAAEVAAAIGRFAHD